MLLLHVPYVPRWKGQYIFVLGGDASYYSNIGLYELILCTVGYHLPSDAPEDSIQRIGTAIVLLFHFPCKKESASHPIQRQTLNRCSKVQVYKTLGDGLPPNNRSDLPDFSIPPMQIIHFRVLESRDQPTGPCAITVKYRIKVSP